MGGRAASFCARSQGGADSSYSVPCYSPQDNTPPIYIQIHLHIYWDEFPRRFPPKQGGGGERDENGDFSDSKETIAQRFHFKTFPIVKKNIPRRIRYESRENTARHFRCPPSSREKQQLVKSSGEEVGWVASARYSVCTRGAKCSVSQQSEAKLSFKSMTKPRHKLSLGLAGQSIETRSSRELV